MRFIELFAGIGGFRYGLEKASKSNIQPEDSAMSEGESPQHRGHSLYTCVWANEIDKYACQIYRKNFGGRDGQRLCIEDKEKKVPRIRNKEGQCSKQLNSSPKRLDGCFDERSKLYEGDITKISTDLIPDHDLLVGGFPCQAFSIAGKRGGFDDTRGTLFFEIARILRDKRPRCVLLENVKGLLSHDSGKTFQTILKTLSDLGYRVEWQVLNSKDFGVPQNRERVFIIGHLGKRSRGQVFPISGQGGQTNGTVYPCLTPDRIKKRQNGQRFKKVGESSFTLTGQDIHGVMEVKNDFSKDISNRGPINNRTFSFTDKALTEVVKIRRLTPTECERLQGFPDGWTEGISDTQRYKCLGNAVTTNVIRAIGERIMDIWVLNAQTRNPNRPSLKYSSGGSGPLWKKNEAFCLPTSGGSGQYIVTPTTKTEREESDMSMENELKRIADALERIETKIGAPLKLEEGKPVTKRKSTKAIKETTEEPVELTMVAGEEPEETLTPAGLMAYCNAELTKIKDVPKRTAVIKKVVAMFKEDFGVSSVKETPADRVDEAKAAFDAIVERG